MYKIYKLESKNIMQIFGLIKDIELYKLKKTDSGQDPSKLIKKSGG